MCIAGLSTLIPFCVQAAVAGACALVEGEAMVATSTLGMVVVLTFLSRSQWMQSQSVAKNYCNSFCFPALTCVPVFDVVIGLIL